jgi:hypothetical protein
MPHVQANEIVAYGRSHKVHQAISIHIIQRQGINTQVVPCDVASNRLHHLRWARPIARDDENLPTSRGACAGSPRRNHQVAVAVARKVGHRAARTKTRARFTTLEGSQQTAVFTRIHKRISRTRYTSHRGRIVRHKDIRHAVGIVVTCAIGKKQAKDGRIFRFVRAQRVNDTAVCPGEEIRFAPHRRDQRQ